jgi:hypothetical protein
MDCLLLLGLRMGLRMLMGDGWSELSTVSRDGGRVLRLLCYCMDYLVLLVCVPPYAVTWGLCLYLVLGRGLWGLLAAAVCCSMGVISTGGLGPWTLQKDPSKQLAYRGQVYYTRARACSGSDETLLQGMDPLVSGIGRWAVLSRP